MQKRAATPESCNEFHREVRRVNNNSDLNILTGLTGSSGWFLFGIFHLRPPPPRREELENDPSVGEEKGWMGERKALFSHIKRGWGTSLNNQTTISRQDAPE